MLLFLSQLLLNKKCQSKQGRYTVHNHKKLLYYIINLVHYTIFMQYQNKLVL